MTEHDDETKIEIPARLYGKDHNLIKAKQKKNILKKKVTKQKKRKQIRNMQKQQILVFEGEKRS